MRIRSRSQVPTAGLTTAQLAAKLGEAEVERDRAAAALEAFESTIEESLALVDGGEALGEVSPEQAAADRGEVASEGDALRADAARTSRAADYVQGRLVEVAREEGEALKIEPLAAYRSAVAERDNVAAILAEREHDVVSARAIVDEAERAGQAIRVQHDPAAREADRVERNRRSTAISWAVRQVGTMGIKQLPLEYQADAMAAVEQRNAEVAARTREPEGEDGSIPSHADWPRLGAA